MLCGLLCGLLRFCLETCILICVIFFFFQAEDGIRYLVRSRGLGDVYKRQLLRTDDKSPDSSLMKITIDDIIAFHDIIAKEGLLLSLIHI